MRYAKRLLMTTITTEPMNEFNGAIHNEKTRALYKRNLSYFFKHISTTPKGFVKLGDKKQTLLIDTYINDLKSLVEQKKLEANTVRSRYAPVKLFCQMNDILVNFAKFEKKLPSVETHKERLPTNAEIKSLYDNCRKQGRALLRLLLETGMRIEGASDLTIKDFEPIDDTICKVTVYRNSKDEYPTFCSMPTFELVKQYAKSEKRIFPRLGGCRAILYRAWKRAGVKVDFPSNHFARKWFKTNAERSGAKSLWIEALMGHAVGLNRNYMRENFNDIVEAYRKILPYLSLSGNGNGETDKKLQSQEERLQRIEGQNASMITGIADVLTKLQTGEKLTAEQVIEHILAVDDQPRNINMEYPQGKEEWQPVTLDKSDKHYAKTLAELSSIGYRVKTKQGDKVVLEKQ